MSLDITFLYYIPPPQKLEYEFPMHPFALVTYGFFLKNRLQWMACQDVTKVVIVVLAIII